jgi:hypothetical protein
VSKELWFDSSQKLRDIYLFESVQRGPLTFISHGNWRLSLQGLSGWGVKLTIRSLYSKDFGNERNNTSTPPYCFMAYTGQIPPTLHPYSFSYSWSYIILVIESVVKRHFKYRPQTDWSSVSLHFTASLMPSSKVKPRNVSKSISCFRQAWKKIASEFCLFRLLGYRLNITDCPFKQLVALSAKHVRGTSARAARYFEVLRILSNFTRTYLAISLKPTSHLEAPLPKLCTKCQISIHMQ